MCLNNLKFFYFCFTEDIIGYSFKANTSFARCNMVITYDAKIQLRTTNEAFLIYDIYLCFFYTIVNKKIIKNCSRLNLYRYHKCCCGYTQYCCHLFVACGEHQTKHTCHHACYKQRQQKQYQKDRYM